MMGRWLGHCAIKGIKVGRMKAYLGTLYKRVRVYIKLARKIHTSSK
jgi:hypothetical protein